MHPQTISHYRIVKKLGEGGMGEVYLGEDTRLGRKVAIKLLPPKSTGDEKAQRRFRREAQAAATLDHPNICAIYEIGEASGTTFIVMQYIEGETLSSRMRTRPLDLLGAVGVAAQTADALAEAHSHGVIHRDIKPQNIMLTARGEAKVLDFGLAKMMDEGSSTDTQAQTQSLLSTPGMMIGTVPYMSPEQVRGEALDARSDIFSFGTVLYELVGGVQPFAADSAASTVSSILTRTPPPLARYAHEVPPELERIVSKALVKDPEGRYQTMKDMLIDLKRLKQQIEFETELGRSGMIDTGTGEKPAMAVNHASIRSSPARVSIATTPPATVATDPVGGRLNRARLVLLVILGAAALAASAIYYFWPRGEAAIDSIAVLPFDNKSADPEAEYLSDGITDGLINNLSQLPGMKVIAHSSVFRFKNAAGDPAEVGRQLRVRALVTGRIVLRGDNLTIAVELADVRDGHHLWGGQYERRTSDLLALQKEITKELSESLRAKLTGDETSRITNLYTANNDAYQSYLKGLYHLNRRTGDGFNKAIDYFNQAIGSDPTYAQAYAGLADCYNLLAEYELLAGDEASPKARAAAKQALAITETLPEAHASFGSAAADSLDFTLAEAEFKRAIELNPNYATAHHWYGMLLSAMGRFQDAASELKLAQELDPLSLIISANVGWTQFLQRDTDRAIEQYRETLRMDSNFSVAYHYLGIAYADKGLYKEAIEAFQTADGLSGGGAFNTAHIGYVYAVSGKRREAEKVIEQLKQQSLRSQVSPWGIALIYVGLGNIDQSFEWLDKAYDARAFDLQYLKVDPRFEGLRQDRRFQMLLRRMGLSL